MGIAESLKLTAFYIAIAMAFGAWIWIERGAELGMQYYTGFFIEKALSIDNVFVISLIFTFFAIPARFQYRALLWGIIAVIVLRGLIERHVAETNSRSAAMRLHDWARVAPRFWQVVPKEYVKYLPAPLDDRPEALRA